MIITLVSIDMVHTRQSKGIVNKHLGDQPMNKLNARFSVVHKFYSMVSSLAYSVLHIFQKSMMPFAHGIEIGNSSNVPAVRNIVNSFVPYHWLPGFHIDHSYDGIIPYRHQINKEVAL